MLFRQHSVSESVVDLRCRRTCTDATLDFSIFQYVAAWQNACDIDVSIASDGTASREGVQEKRMQMKPPLKSFWPVWNHSQQDWKVGQHARNKNDDQNSSARLVAVSESGNHLVSFLP